MLRLVCLVVVAMAAPASAAHTSCTVRDIAKARVQAEALLKAGDYAEAAKVLENIVCFVQWQQSAELNLAIAWSRSDLAFAYYKAGDYKGCYRIGEAETTPYAGNVASVVEDDRVLDALSHNATICYEAIEKQRGSFLPAETCLLEERARGIPAGGLAGTDRAACLIIEPGGIDADGMNHCGDVVLVRQSKRGTLTRTVLEISDGNLVQSEVCCNLEDISFANRGNTFALLAKTGGRNCDGGTAASAEEHVYELAGQKLVLGDALNVGYH